MSNNYIIDPPKRPKLITGTKFATVLDKNPWQSQFEVWADVVRLGNTFEANKYTTAGNVIEPIIIDYLKRMYEMDLVTPQDIYGDDPFKATWGNFYEKEHEPFGGMWDALLKEDGEVNAVVEIKTTSRHEDWLHEAPEYYALQGALYAHLLGLDNVVMVVGLLDASIYDNPESFVPSGSNLYVYDFKISEKFPNFEEYCDEIKNWYEFHVKGGISPEYDDKKDSKILEVINKTYVSPTSSIQTLLDSAEILYMEIKEHDDKIKDKKDKLSNIQDLIKEYCYDNMGDKDKVVMKGNNLEWSLSRGKTEKIDKKAIKKDGLSERYITIQERLTLRKKEIN